MGSEIDVIAWADAPHAAMKWALTEVARLEASWSRFLVTSELSALNRSAGAGPFTCSPTLWAAVSRAATGWEATGGLFDPTILATLVALGYDRTFTDVAAVTAVEADSRHVPGFDVVRLDAAARTVALPVGVSIDLGGVGKGLAADLLVEGLLARRVTSGQVSLGGDMRVFGPGADADDAWMIDVHHPADDRTLFRFPLVDEALVQSTRLIRRWERAGRPLHHLVDPRTGWPADNGLVSVIATAAEAWFAEVVAKAVFVAGERDGLALARRLGVDVWLVRDDDTIVATPDVADTLPASGG